LSLADVAKTASLEPRFAGGRCFSFDARCLSMRPTSTRQREKGWSLPELVESVELIDKGDLYPPAREGLVTLVTLVTHFPAPSPGQRAPW
jgi:hypothetical protein